MNPDDASDGADDGRSAPGVRGREPPAQRGAALSRWMQYLAWLLPVLERFPRSQRFLLGDRLQGLALDTLEWLIGAQLVAHRLTACPSIEARAKSRAMTDTTPSRLVPSTNPAQVRTMIDARPVAGLGRSTSPEVAVIVRAKAVSVLDLAATLPSDKRPRVSTEDMSAWR